MNVEGSVGAADAFEVWGGTLDEDVAGLLCCTGVGADGNFIEDKDVVTDSLHEEHAHGIDVEVEGPDERGGHFKADVADVGFAVESEIGAVVSDDGELSFKFLAESVVVHFAAGGIEL